MASLVEQILLSINATVTGAAGVSQLTGNIGGLTSKLVGLNAGMQVVGQITAGVNQLVGQMREWADAANKAATDTKVFELTLGRFGISVEGANGAAQRLADKFGLSVESVKGSMTNLIRAGFHDMGQLEEVMTGAAASAVAFGRSASDGFERVGDAAVTGLSAALNSIGISENLGPAFDKYAKSLGKTADELTDVEKAQTLANLVTKATRTEVDALGSIQNDYVRSQQAASLAQNEFNKAMGTLTLPLVTKFNQASAESVGAIVELVKAYSKGEDGLGKFAAKFPLLSGVMGKIGPEGERMKAALGGAWDAIRGTYDTVLVPIFERLEPLAKRVWAEVPRLVTAAGKLIGETFLLIQSLWENRLKPVWDAIAPIVEAAFGQVVRLLGGAFDFIRGIFEAARKWLDGDWKGAWEAARDAVGNALLKIQDALAELAPILWKAITDIATNAYTKARVIGLNLKDGLIAGMSGLAADLATLMDNAIDKMTANIPDWVKDRLGMSAADRARAQRIDDLNDTSTSAQSRIIGRTQPQQGPQMGGTAGTGTDVSGKALLTMMGLGGRNTGTPFGGKYFGGQIHNGEDIFAKTGTQLVAGFTGYITTRWSETTGHIIEMIDAEGKKLVLGHLDRYAEGVEEAIKAANAQGKQLLVKQGDLIGYVGQTGSLAHKDLGPGNSHVHAMGYTANGKLVNPLSQTYKSVQGEGNAVYTPPTPTANSAAKNTGNPSPDAPVASSAESVRKAVEAQIKDILARVDLKLISKDAAIKLLAAVDAEATRVARKQGTGWQEYAATAKTAESAIEGLKKGNSSAKETKDLLTALSTQFEYAGKTGLPAYVAGLNAFIAAQDKAAKSAKAGSKEQVEAQANVNRARQMLKDSAGPKGEVVASDADLKKYSAAALQIAKLEAAIPNSTDTAWVARAQARIAAYNAQGAAAQAVLGIVSGTYAREKELDNKAAEDLKKIKADQETAAKTLTSLNQDQLQQRVDGQEAAEKEIARVRDLALKAAGTDAQARLSIEQNASAALKQQAKNTAEAQLILAKRTAEEAYRTTISGIPEKASAAQVQAITEAAQKVRSGSVSGAYTSYYGAIGKAAEEGRDRVAAAQDALTASLQSGVDAGNAALASLDTSKLSGQELAGAAQLLIPAGKTFDALYIRLIAMRQELATPGVADAWADSIAELGKRGRLSAEQVSILKAVITDLNTAAKTLQLDNTEGRGLQNEAGALDPSKGVLAAGEPEKLLTAMLGMSPQELGGILAGLVAKGFGESDLAKLIRGALQDDANAIDDALRDFGNVSIDVDTGKLIFQTEEQLRGIGVAAEDTKADFFDLGSAAQNVISMTREELDGLLTTSKLLPEQVEALTKAWQDFNGPDLATPGAMLGSLIGDLQTAQDAFDSGGATLDDTLSRFDSLRAVAASIDNDAARALVTYIDQFTTSWKEMRQATSNSETTGAMLGNLIDEMQGVQDAFDLGGAGLDDTLAKFEALRAKAASIDDDGARGLVAYIDQFTASWKQLRQETTSMEADGSAIGGLIDQLQAAQDAFYGGGASIEDTRAKLADLREQLTLIGGPVATALIGAVDEMATGFDRAAQSAADFMAALDKPSAIEKAAEQAVSGLDELIDGYRAGSVTAAQFAAACLPAAKELERLARAADRNNQPELAASLRLTAEALKAMTPAAAKAAEKLGKFAEYAGYIQQLAGAFSGLASAVGNDDLAANLDGVANFAGKAIALAGDVVRILANPADVGAWVGAITKIVSGIADAIGGFQRARAEAKKLADDFNKQFSLIDGSTFSKFTTRSRGFFADFFGGGPEVVKQINESAAAIAKTIETGVLGGFTNGIKAFLNGTGTMLDAIREGVRGAIIDAITQAVIQGAIIKGALGSLLTELTNGLAAGTDVSGVIAQIGAALPGIAKGLETTLKPLKDAVDKALPATTTAGSASTSNSSFGSGSATFQAGTPREVIDVLAQARDLLKSANDVGRLQIEAARQLGGHVDRFGDYVDKLNGPHNSATAGAR
ncbi:hypothetical protein ACFFLM_04385 [Deinococcus oregonensis]|uniref:Peptidase M23 domain-containing protein n=1 Tax=Deinococcus oregonensis TaxID=1805970 RepID=A0ABV6AWZ0_9DEIO